MKAKKIESKLITALNSPDRFKLLPDGWIQDIYTGLDFGPSSDKCMNFKYALKYCTDKGGRLPEAHELHSLVNFAKNSPATYDILKDTKYDDWYWSNTKHSYYKDARWCVSFRYGFVDFGYEYGVNYVRPVRSSQ